MNSSPRRRALPRVLHVMESTIGGTRRHLVDVAGGLAERGWEVGVVAAALRQPDFRGDLARLAAAGVRVRELPLLREIRPGRDLAHGRALLGELAAFRPDVVHTHSSKAGVLGRLASWLAESGVRVHTPHTFAFLFRDMFGPLRRRLFFELERHLAGMTSRLCAVSESEAETFRRSGVVDPERVAVIPNGIDPRPWTSATPVPAQALALDPTRPIALVVGLLNVAKGQDLALEALAQPGGEVWQLVLVGHGEERERLERLAERRGLSARVRFVGYRRDVPDLLAGADLLLLPSRWEGMPYVVLEAMAAGRAVVATPVDGARELVEEGRTGWLAERIDAAAIAEALGRAWEAGPEGRARAGALGRERVIRDHSRTAMLDRLEALYHEVLGEARCASST